jgi:hypothetical protein
MVQAVEASRGDSDVSLFMELLYFGEMLIKTVTAGLVASIMDDRDRHRYRQLHRLVRADSLGEWTSVIDEVLVGPASQFLASAARDVQRELTERLGAGTWQHSAVVELDQCIRVVDPSWERMPARVDARRAFTLFAVLRNKTRGHGATQGETCSRLCPHLESGLRLIAENLSLFAKPWAFLHRNLSGKYRVTSLNEAASAFDYLKRTNSISIPNGIYLLLDGPCRVDLIESTVDAEDFLYVNGGFNGKRYELLSYVTDTKTTADAGPFLAPASALPGSATEGAGELTVQGSAFGNLPPLPHGYIMRPGIEAELMAVLLDDRHPIVTLSGRGGIGKTSVALAVLHRISEGDRFAAVVWFSGRDIDLLPEGAKVVRPQVVTNKDIAEEFVALLAPSDAQDRKFSPVSYLEQYLTSSPIGPVLFVVDNFETVYNPIDVFNWLDGHVRSPNKILITTRQREFRGDFPIEVLGMIEDEFDELVDTTAAGLGITRLLTNEYRHELYRESDGHPYVAKILLGEVAKADRLVNVERIIATKEGILDALFERTFAGLSPAARRVFLTLSSWQSTVPLIAIEAVLLRSARERLDVEAATEELSRSSFVELRTSPLDGNIFVTVPLVAAIFGRRKLAASELKSIIGTDTDLLRSFGAAQPSDIRRGLQPRIERLFRNVANRLSSIGEPLESYLPMLEFVAGKYPPAWLLLADLLEESGGEAGIDRSKAAVRRYLETAEGQTEQRAAWERLGGLCRQTGDWLGEAHAVVEAVLGPRAPFRAMSNAVNRLNNIFKLHGVLDTYEKETLVRRLIEAMEGRLDEADATDYSRLAWLSLQLGDEMAARRFTSQGLRLDVDNEYCVKLARRLGLM